MNIRELYDKGHRRFRFSNGDIKEPCKVTHDDGQSLGFPAGYGGGRIWYLDDGRPNVGGALPTIVGVVEDEGMSEQGERSKRDEIQRAIEQGVSNAAAPIGDDDYNEIVTRVLHELDSLVERWTDEETAEDLSRTLKNGDEYKGMRLKVVGYCEDYNEGIDPPIGATGTVVKDDQDGIPGVQFDEPWSYLNDEDTQYKYTVIETTEKVEE